MGEEVRRMDAGSLARDGQALELVQCCEEFCWDDGQWLSPPIQAQQHVQFLVGDEGKGDLLGSEALAAEKRRSLIHEEAGQMKVVGNVCRGIGHGADGKGMRPRCLASPLLPLVRFCQFWHGSDKYPRKR
jgi:hypothetical protein